MERKMDRARMVAALVLAAAVLVSASVALAVPYSTAVLADGPVAYYRLEEARYAGDQSRSTNIGYGEYLHGNYIDFDSGQQQQPGPRAPARPAFGTYNHAPEFDGSNNLVQRTDGSSQGPYLDITGPLTLEAWVRVDSLPTGNPDGIVAKYVGSGNQRSYSLSLTSAGRLEFVISPYGTYGNGSGTGTNARSASSTGSMAAGDWHHVAATYTPSQSMKFYIDGAPAGTVTTNIPSQIAQKNAPLWIGNYYDQTRYFDGRIDEVAVYNKALSDDQIAAHYATATSPTFLPDSLSGLQVWYQVDDGTELRWDDGISGYRTDTWQDSSGGGHDMVQSGSFSPPLEQDRLPAGFPAIHFDGGNDRMSAGDVEVHSNTDGLTVVALCKLDSTTNDGTIVSKYDSGATPTKEREWMLRTTMFSVQDDPLVYNSSMNANFTIGDTDWHIITGRWLPGAAPEAYLDGEPAGTAASLVKDIADTTAPLMLGSINRASGFWFDGELAEVLVYNRALTDAERGAVETYLFHKYAIPEPTTLALLGIGLAAVARRRRRR